MCLLGPYLGQGRDICRMVSEYCSVRVSRVGLPTKQATEPYLDNPSEPYSDNGIPLRRALRRLLCWLGSHWEFTENWDFQCFTAWNRARNRARTPPEFAYQCQLALIIFMGQNIIDTNNLADIPGNHMDQHMDRRIRIFLKEVPPTGTGTKF